MLQSKDFFPKYNYINETPNKINSYTYLANYNKKNSTSTKSGSVADKSHRYMNGNLSELPKNKNSKSINKSKYSINRNINGMDKNNSDLFIKSSNIVYKKNNKSERKITNEFKDKFSRSPYDALNVYNLSYKNTYSEPLNPYLCSSINANIFHYMDEEKIYPNSESNYNNIKLTYIMDSNKNDIDNNALRNINNLVYNNGNKNCGIDVKEENRNYSINTNTANNKNKNNGRYSKVNKDKFSTSFNTPKERNKNINEYIKKFAKNYNYNNNYDVCRYNYYVLDNNIKENKYLNSPSSDLINKINSVNNKNITTNTNNKIKKYMSTDINDKNVFQNGLNKENISINDSNAYNNISSGISQSNNDLNKQDNNLNTKKDVTDNSDYHQNVNDNIYDYNNGNNNINHSINNIKDSNNDNINNNSNYINSSKQNKNADNDYNNKNNNDNYNDRKNNVYNNIVPLTFSSISQSNGESKIRFFEKKYPENYVNYSNEGDNKNDNDKSSINKNNKQDNKRSISANAGRTINHMQDNVRNVSFFESADNRKKRDRVKKGVHVKLSPTKTDIRALSKEKNDNKTSKICPYRSISSDNVICFSSNNFMYLEKREINNKKPNNTQISKEINENLDGNLKKNSGNDKIIYNSINNCNNYDVKKIANNLKQFYKEIENKENDNNNDKNNNDNNDDIIKENKDDINNIVNDDNNMNKDDLENNDKDNIDGVGAKDNESMKDNNVIKSVKDLKDDKDDNNEPNNVIKSVKDLKNDNANNNEPNNIVKTVKDLKNDNANNNEPNNIVKTVKDVKDDKVNNIEHDNDDINKNQSKYDTDNKESNINLNHINTIRNENSIEYLNNIKYEDKNVGTSKRESKRESKTNDKKFSELKPEKCEIFFEGKSPSNTNINNNIDSNNDNLNNDNLSKIQQGLSKLNSYMNFKKKLHNFESFNNIKCYSDVLKNIKNYISNNGKVAKKPTFLSNFNSNSRDSGDNNNTLRESKDLNGGYNNIITFKDFKPSNYDSNQKNIPTIQENDSLNNTYREIDDKKDNIFPLNSLYNNNKDNNKKDNKNFDNVDDLELINIPETDQKLDQNKEKNYNSNNENNIEIMPYNSNNNKNSATNPAYIKSSNFYLFDIEKPINLSIFETKSKENNIKKLCDLFDKLKKNKKNDAFSSIKVYSDRKNIKKDDLNPSLQNLELGLSKLDSLQKCLRLDDGRFTFQRLGELLSLSPRNLNSNVKTKMEYSDDDNYNIEDTDSGIEQNKPNSGSKLKTIKSSLNLSKSDSPYGNKKQKKDKTREIFYLPSEYKANMIIKRKNSRKKVYETVENKNIKFDIHSNNLPHPVRAFDTFKNLDTGDRGETTSLEFEDEGDKNIYINNLKNVRRNNSVNRTDGNKKSNKDNPRNNSTNNNYNLKTYINNYNNNYNDTNMNSIPNVCKTQNLPDSTNNKLIYYNKNIYEKTFENTDNGNGNLDTVKYNNSNNYRNSDMERNNNFNSNSNNPKLLSYHRTIKNYKTNSSDNSYRNSGKNSDKNSKKNSNNNSNNNSNKIEISSNANGSNRFYNRPNLKEDVKKKNQFKEIYKKMLKKNNDDKEYIRDNMIE